MCTAGTSKQTSTAADRLAAPVGAVAVLVLILLNPDVEVPAAAGGGCHVAAGMVSKAGHIPTSAATEICYSCYKVAYRLICQWTALYAEMVSKADHIPTSAAPA